MILRDPTSRSNRLIHLSKRTTVGTSGHFLRSSTNDSLNPQIKIINEKDLITGTDICIGKGRFGTCYQKMYNHYHVCVKVCYASNSSFISEANILSRFAHPNLPYLFGVCVGESPSIVLSYHGFGNHSITIDCALFTQSQTIKEAIADIKWLTVLKEIACGLDNLHARYQVIHNDLKNDNIMLTMTRPIIIDFGKACDVSKARFYKLSQKEKEKYRQNHCHIAPDLRDGICKQSFLSDIYSFGRIVQAMNMNTTIHCKALEELSNKCMQYYQSQRPDMAYIKQSISSL